MGQRFPFSLFGGGSGSSASRDASNKIHKAIGLVSNTPFVVYGNGTELGRATVDILGNATVTLATAPGAGVVITYGQVFPGGTIPAFVPVPGGSVIGGVAINAAGAAGTAYEGYSLSDGMTFASMPSFVSSAAPKGDLFDTRGYLLPAAAQTPRSAGAGGLTLKGYDVGPTHQGYLDANRGQPVASWQDLIATEGSALVLKSRAASAQEKALTDGKDILSAMIHTGGRLVCRPPCIMEARIRLEAGAFMNKAWHPTLWLQLMGAANSQLNIEIDWEANDAFPQSLSPNAQNWTSGLSTSIGSNAENVRPGLMDGGWYNVGFRLREDGFDYLIDGVVIVSKVFNMRSKGDRAAYLMLTNHVADFAGQYSLSSWQSAGATGGRSSIEWLRMWRQTGTIHRKPLVETADLKMAFGTTASRTMPSLADQFGDATVAETFEALVHDVLAPGGNTDGGWTGLPSFVTRVGDTVTIANPDKPGRLYFARVGAKAGETCQPARWVCDVGPNLRGGPELNFTTGVTQIDLYPMADVGDLLPKTVAVSNLPAGVTYNPATFLLTWDGTTTIVPTQASITVTNAVGQSVTVIKTVKPVSNIAPPVVDGLAYSIDPGDAAKRSVTGSDVDTMGGSDGTTAVALATAPNRPTLVARNGRQTLRFTSANSQRMDMPGHPAGDVSFTRVLIVELATTTATQCLVSTADPASSTTTNRAEQLFVSADTTLRTRRSTAGGPVDASVPHVAGRHIIIEDVIAGTSRATARVDGSNAVTSAATSTAPVGATTTTLGARRGAGAYDAHADAYLFRGLVYSRLLTLTEKRELAAWACTYYGTL
ncbi:hypothetical protein [Methylobacterium flocculans]|uniref:hypothetical protein n=1 Tax=Methylobacterium flocculans TaxID=2984843 RepID=UPI0021F30F9E|nr:hypothetical protein [Methylobacterium sp. FF17]